MTTPLKIISVSDRERTNICQTLTRLPIAVIHQQKEREREREREREKERKRERERERERERRKAFVFMQSANRIGIFRQQYLTSRLLWEIQLQSNQLSVSTPEQLTSYSDARISLTQSAVE